MNETPRPHNIALIHGWDPSLYNSVISRDASKNSAIAWKKFPAFLEALSRTGSLSYYNLPGFCGVSEPRRDYYDVADFADDLSAWRAQNTPADVLIGYSFGAAVVLSHKVRCRDSTPIILISPAIRRRETIKSSVAHNVVRLVPQTLRNRLKGIYQWLASKYYRRGTAFLRSTYDKIVRQDLISLIDEVPLGEILFIFGANDTETPWSLIKDRVVNKGHEYYVVDGAGHSVTRTHSALVVERINTFVNRKG